MAGADVQALLDGVAAELGVLERWCVPVRFRGAHLGYVWALASADIDTAQLGPAVEAAEHIGALLYRRGLSTQADTDLLRLLLIPNPESEQAAAEARASGAHTYKGPIAVVVAGAPDDAELGHAALGDLGLAAQRAAERPPRRPC